MVNRREALASLASAAAALPFVSGCGPERASNPSMSTETDTVKLLDEIADNLLKLQPESATSLGIDTGARAVLRSQLGDRSAGRTAASRAIRSEQDLDRVTRDRRPPACRIAARTSVEVVRSAYATALEGFALPYGDITVGGWRNTPYVVIQNVGAYLDIPRFLDSDHPDRERRRRRGVSRAPAVLREAARRRARAASRRARDAGLVPPAFLIDKALAQMRSRSRVPARAAALVESIVAADRPHSRQLGASAHARSPCRRSRRRSSARSPNSRRSAPSPPTMPGMWARPHGDEFYRWALKASTTTAMTPDEVHAMGRSELERLHVADGRDHEGHRPTPGQRRRADESDRQGSRNTSSPTATRAAPRSWPSSRIA